MDFTLSFLIRLFWGIYLTLPPLLFLCLVIAGLGLIAGRLEGWSRFNALYWAFITALTVGYGDLRPEKTISKILSLIIAVIGIMLFGILVAITVTTFTSAFEEYVKLSSVGR